jgi:hypothetical protein
MSSPHPRPWHRQSCFGPGPRRPLCREQRARYRFLLNAHRRARHISPMAEHVGDALLKRLGVDGQCDPSHETIADDAGCCARTVRRALADLKACGLVAWVQRIVRSGWRVTQTSNAYELAPTEKAWNPCLPAPRPVCPSVRRGPVPFPVPPVPPAHNPADAAALAVVRARRAVLLGVGR